MSAKDCFSCLTVIMWVSLVDGDVHGCAVLGVESQHPGAGCGARLLLVSLIGCGHDLCIVLVRDALELCAQLGTSPDIVFGSTTS